MMGDRPAEVFRDEPEEVSRVQVIDRAPALLGPRGVELVVALVAREYGYAPAELTAKTRGTQSLANARHIAMTLCREFTDVSALEISKLFQKDPSSVRRAVSRCSSTGDLFTTCEQVRRRARLRRQLGTD